MKSKKFNIILISLKNTIIPIILCSFMIFLILFSTSNIIAAKNGLELWATTVVPSLFPFLFATELLGKTKIVQYLGKTLNKIMRPLFNVPGEGSFAFIMGLISGYPVGAKIVTDFRNNGICTKDEGNRMLAFTNNSGPLFIIGTVGIGLFANKSIGLLLFITHFMACITVGVIFKFFSKNDLQNLPHSSYKPSVSSSNSISTILMIGSYVVIFSVVISILNQLHILDLFSVVISPLLGFFNINLSFAVPILSGIIELTNGINLVSLVHVKDISTNIAICAFLLGFGGISVCLQVYSIISKSDLSIKKYIIGKFFQGVFASIYTLLALKYIPILNLDIKATFAPISICVTYPISILGFNNYFVLFGVLCIIVCFVFSIPSKKSNNC